MALGLSVAPPCLLFDVFGGGVVVAFARALFLAHVVLKSPLFFSLFGFAGECF